LDRSHNGYRWRGKRYFADQVATRPPRHLIRIELSDDEPRYETYFLRRLRVEFCTLLLVSPEKSFSRKIYRYLLPASSLRIQNWT
jgi:hypothetical protein